MSTTKEFDVIVVGAGFAGLYALHKLKQLGFSVLVIEAGDGVGGTWYWNRYPGARCDVNSLEYSFQFSEELQQQWSWSEKYAPQAEILDYANHVADRFELRENILFSTRISAMKYLQECSSWLVTSESGQEFVAKFCIMATGCLSKPNTPSIDGIESYEGELLHTGLWPKETVSFEGKKVGLVGTGSSAIQATPLIAESAKSLSVFQRTASFSVPAHNQAMDKNAEERIKANYKTFRAQNSKRYAALDNQPSSLSALDVDENERHSIYEERWQKGGLPFLAAFKDINTDAEANRTAVEFVHEKIRSLVSNPEVADKLCPDTILGCKRLCVDTDYYSTFNRSNVELVDLRSTPMESITKKGIKTNECEYELDMIILATGFDAMTGALLAIDIQGRDGMTLQEKWRDGPANYLGLSVNGFPNLFTVTGPGSPSVLANMIVAIEQHIDWIAECLKFLRDSNKASIEATRDAETQWVQQVNDIAEHTLFAHGCASWYTGANIPGKPRIFMPYLGYPAYVEKCNEVASNQYAGFDFPAQP